jgi:hypothetical protein
MKIYHIDRNNKLLFKTILHITVKITIIGNRTNVSDSLIIIPAGIHIGHGIMDVCTRRIGINGTGVLHSILVLPIILINGVTGILIQDMAMDIHIILVRLRRAISAIREMEIAD